MRANATPLSLQVISIKPIAPGNIEVSAEQARVANHISDKPLVVLTAGRPIDAALRATLTADDQRVTYFRVQVDFPNLHCATSPDHFHN